MFAPGSVSLLRHRHLTLGSAFRTGANSLGSNISVPAWLSANLSFWVVRHRSPLRRGPDFTRPLELREAVAVAVAFSCRRVDGRRRLRSTRCGRYFDDLGYQAGSWNAVRVVGHLALRPVLHALAACSLTDPGCCVFGDVSKEVRVTHNAFFGAPIGSWKVCGVGFGRLVLTSMTATKHVAVTHLHFEIENRSGSARSFDAGAATTGGFG